MAQLLENFLPVVNYHGLNTDKAVAFGSTLSVAGATTLASLAVTGAFSSGTSLYKDLTEVVTTTNVITAAESGSVFFLDNAVGFVSTLPAVAAGLHFTFIVKTQPTSGTLNVVGASGTPIVGHVLTTDVNSATDPDFGISGELTVNFVNSKAVKGDMAEFWCDGTNWYMTAKCSVFDAITLA